MHLLLPLDSSLDLGAFHCWLRSHRYSPPWFGECRLPSPGVRSFNANEPWGFQPQSSVRSLHPALPCCHQIARKIIKSNLISAPCNNHLSGLQPLPAEALFHILHVWKHWIMNGLGFGSPAQGCACTQLPVVVSKLLSLLLLEFLWSPSSSFPSAAVCPVVSPSCSSTSSWRALPHDVLSLLHAARGFGLQCWSLTVGVGNTPGRVPGTLGPLGCCSPAVGPHGTPVELCCAGGCDQCHGEWVGDVTAGNSQVEEIQILGFETPSLNPWAVEKETVVGKREKVSHAVVAAGLVWKFKPLIWAIIIS